MEWKNTGFIDPKVFPSRTTTLNGTKYFYIDQPAVGKQKGVVFCVHGWPDSWYGWRNQIPFLAQEGYRVIVTSQIGFGYGTESPKDLKKYTLKSVCADLAALMEQEKIRKAIFFGHDWGGAVVFKMANYYPKKVEAVMCISTPYLPPAQGRYMTLEQQAEILPNFAYQLYLASDRPMKEYTTEKDFRKFFNALFAPGKGMRVQFDGLSKLDSYQPTTMISEEELQVYIKQYMAETFGPNTNWYRTRKLNYEDDIADFKNYDGKLDMPVLFIATNLDPVLKPEMSAGMEKYIAKLTRKSVETGHWGAVEAKDEVNAFVKEFLMRIQFEKMRHQI